MKQSDIIPKENNPSCAQIFYCISSTRKITADNIVFTNMDYIYDFCSNFLCILLLISEPCFQSSYINMLLSTGHRSEIFDESSFDEWVDLAEAPAITPSLRLYKELQELGFTIFLLTGRGEYQRHATERNLMYAGYTNWEKLILR